MGKSNFFRAFSTLKRFTPNLENEEKSLFVEACPETLPEARQPFTKKETPNFALHASGGRFPAMRGLAVGLLLSMSIGFSGCAGKQVAAPRRTEVEVATPLRKDVPIYSQWIGTTIGYVEAQIHSQVTGYLMSQDYKEGAFVKRGDVLFQVDPRPFQSVVNLAAARVEAAKAQLTEAKAEVQQAKDEIDRAKADQMKTELDVKRFMPLVSDGTISQRELDDAIQANLANKASVAAAFDHHDRAVAKVAKAQANVAVAESAYDKAKLELGFTRVAAPVDGVAGIRMANIGDLVGANPPTLLTTVAQINPIYVEFSISEQEYLKLRPFLLEASINKKPVLRLTLADGTAYPHMGTINILGLKVDSSTGTLRIRGLFPNPGNVLRPGQYAMIKTLTETKKSALLVPQRAVEELQGMYEIAVVGPDSKVQFREVKVGERTGAYWQIEDGLNPGEKVVVEGLQKIRTGTLVDPEPAKLPPWKPPVS